MRPSLIHAQDVEIEQIQRVDAPDIDSVFDEPVSGTNATYATAVQLRAQVAYNKFLDSNPEVIGDDPVTTGHLTFRVYDLAKMSVTLQKGDRISKISGTDVELYIVEVKPKGHYNKPTLIMVEFINKRLVEK